MNDKYDEVFNEIVLAVARLMFGDLVADSPILQGLVKHALINLGVWESLERLRDDE